MSFYGQTFIFDSVPSEFYDLMILDIHNSGGTTDSPAGNDVEILQKWIYRKTKPYFYGNIQNQALEFDVTIGSLNPLTGLDRGKISKWLLGRGGYLKFQIVQDDIADTYYNVIFTSASNFYVGNVQRGLTLHAVCDAPWGWTFPKTLSYTFTGDEIKNFNLNFYNDSHDNGYLYPITEFSLNSIGNSFQITNYSDNNRIFLFSDMQPNETVEIDNDLQTVVSDTGLLRLANFNKNWFRLVPGLNSLNIISGIGTFSMTYQFARTLGG